MKTTEKCLFDQWYDGDIKNLNNFTETIFKAFMFADGINRQIIKSSWPIWFENIKSF